MARLIQVLVAVCLVFPVCLHAQAFTTPVKISTGLNSSDHSPEMHVMRDGTILVSWFTSNANIFFAKSIDGGLSFSAPVRVARQVTTNSYTSLLQRAPEFAIDTKGTIHMVWTEDRTSKQSDVWYVRSTDAGGTWSIPASIMDADDSMKYAQDFPAIAIDSSDNIYVSYLDNRYLMRGIGSHYRMHLQRSTDGGNTWLKPVIADRLPVQNSGTCECCRQDLVVSPEGHVYIAFRTNMTVAPGTDKRDIFIARSMDGGLTFGPSIRAQLGEWTIDACPTTGPHIVLDRFENLHLAWRDNRDDSAKAITYYGLLRKGDTAVFPNYSLSNSRTEVANWPDITVSGDGSLASAYMTGTNDLQLTYSTDGGNNWSEPTAFPTSGSGRQLPILRYAPSGPLYSVWQEDAADGGDIYFAKVSQLPLPNGLGTIRSNASTSYNTGQPVVLSWTAPDQLALSRSIVYDVDVSSFGFHVSRTSRFPTIGFDSLPAAIYNYRIVARSTFDSSVLTGSFSVAALKQDVDDRAGWEKEASIFPNPSIVGGMLKAEIPTRWRGNARAIKCELVDAAGVVAKALAVSGSQSTISIALEGVHAGLYHLRLKRDSETIVLPVSVK